MRPKKVAIVLTLVAVLVLAVAIGLIVGKKQGETAGRKEAESRLNPLLNLAFPKPPTVMTNLTGTVKGVYGATINLEVRDPGDYLPHTDGTSQRTETRYAMVTSATKYFLIDYANPIQGGGPTTKIIKLSDIKVGDSIKVTSTINIRNAERFDVSEIEVVRY